MSSTGKIIKVYLSQNIIEILNKDMTNFGIEINGRNNISRMCNLIFQNYNEAPKKSSIYMKQKFNEDFLEKTIIDSIIGSIEKNEIINLKNRMKYEFEKLVDSIYSNKNTVYSNFISFRLNLKNSILLEEIEKSFGSTVTLSDYFRIIFEDYCLKPQYQREKIIFSENYKKIKDAINNKYNIKLIINKVVYSNSPFGVISNADEQFNYIVGLDENREKRIVRLSKISTILELKNKKSNFSEDEIMRLNKVIQRSDPFIDKYNNIKIRLSENGKRMYNRVVSNRPIVSKIDGDIYTFDCSEDRIYVYFFKFGKDAEILKPRSLRERFKMLYEEALKIYQ